MTSDEQAEYAAANDILTDDEPWSPLGLLMLTACPFVVIGVVAWAIGRALT